MCGIAGILDQTQLPGDSVPVLQQMLARIQYRGPDESGVYINDRVALGSVRLCIMDIASGQQPMSTPEGNLWIVFNGEIFNFIEIKRDLINAGHVFHTSSDTEVLLHAYQEYGTNCFKRLNGQFALAIWDCYKKELLLARDRVGIRPLFYTWFENRLVFASEIKSILEYPGIKVEIDYVALSQVFTFWTAIPPRTIFKNIMELPPGHFMRISLDQKEVCQWWKLRFPVVREEYFCGTFREGADELERLLLDAVRLRLRADVPVAAYLSGGLDSSATTALIKKVKPDSLQTFSIGFEDEEFDETSYQKETSAYLNTKHTAFACKNEDIARYFPNVVWHSEIPLLRTAPVPMFCLSRKVRENNIKVVITGEGADEVLAGYDIFKEAIIREFWSRQPDSKYRYLLLKKLYPYLTQFKDMNKSMLRFFFGYKLSEVDSPFYSHLLRWHNTSRIQGFLSEELRSSVDRHNSLDDLNGMLDNDFGRWDRLSKAQWLETSLFMSGYLLSSQGDRVAMANSVEGRYPFLDYRVIEFAATLPPDFKMKGLNEKYILKRIMHNRLPESVLKRPKQAYRAPIAGSFFSPSAKEYTLELLSEKGINNLGIFGFPAVQKLIKKVTSGEMVTEMENMALTGILSTQLLVHQFVLKDKFRPPLGSLENCRVIREKKFI